jgi:hypothetical protein
MAGDELAVDVQLQTARCAPPVGHVWLTGAFGVRPRCVHGSSVPALVAARSRPIGADPEVIRSG